MLLGIDLGTGSVKALLLSPQGQVLREVSSPYAVHTPQPGWAETHPTDWWAAVAIAVRQVVQDHGETVQAIGLSGQMHGVVLIQSDGQPLRPAILWADMRSRTSLSAYEKLPLEVRSPLANPITAGMAGPTLLWLRHHEPHLYQRAAWVLQPKDWLRWQLTGAVATDPSDASGTLLYDVAGDRWALSTLEALGLRSDWLPPILPSDQVAGHLHPQAADLLGLTAGLPVVTGAADTAAAMVGSGLVEPGSFQLTIGTGAQIVMPRSHPDPALHRGVHLYRAALPGQWYRLAAIQNAGLALDWVRNLLGLSWAQVYTEIASVPAGCEGLTFLPHLTGERTPHLNPNARGAWVGLGLHHTPAHLMRAALEGVAFAIRQGLAAIAPPDDLPAVLWLAGGGTGEPLWQQLLADVLQVPLARVAIASASAQGAARLAGTGIGVSVAIAQPVDPALTRPNTPHTNLEEAWQRFCALYPALASLGSTS